MQDGNVYGISELVPGHGQYHQRYWIAMQTVVILLFVDHHVKCAGMERANATR